MVATQSNYLPWKGYFDNLVNSEKSLFIDCVSYTKNDWRNRNQIIINDSLTWLTIPISFKHGEKIFDINLPTTNWRQKHAKSISLAYAWSKHYSKFIDPLCTLILDESLSKLSLLNIELIKEIYEAIALKKLEYKIIQIMPKLTTKSARLAELLKREGCTEFVTGEKVMNYVNPQDFDDRGIKIEINNYHYQAHETENNKKYFPKVSIIDTLAHLGEGAIKSFERKF